MANWMIQGSNRYLEDLYNRMHAHLLKLDIAMADETTVQVLNETGRAAEAKSYMWLYRSGREGPPIILFDYQTTRANKHPSRFLKGFKGFFTGGRLFRLSRPGRCNTGRLSCACPAQIY